MRGRFVAGFALTVALNAASNAATAETWSLKTLYNFCSVPHCADGNAPESALIRDAAGTLFGVTASGGSGAGLGFRVDAGTVFALSPDGTEQVLYNFCSLQNCTDGVFPQGPLVQDADGNLYGTTGGQTGADQHGLLFRVAPDGTETVLYRFCSVANCADGNLPGGGLLIDRSGNLFGVTFEGGTDKGGTVFELTTDGTETVLYNFCSQQDCADGGGPNGPLVMDKAGNLYGVTSGGGTGRDAKGHPGGTVFKLVPGGAETVLYSFCSQANCADGEQPGGLIRAENGIVYGVTTYGGTGRSSNGMAGSGTVFVLTPDGTEQVLYSFCPAAGCADGGGPNGVVLGKGGDLFGTAEFGGAHKQGAVFEVTRGGSETVIYSFCTAAHCPDGQLPMSGLIKDPAGDLYGTTFAGGSAAQGGGYGGRATGTVFELVR